MVIISAAVVFVYDYLPGAETLDSRHLQGGRRAGALQENLLWDYVVQMTAAIRAIHTADLALYTLDPTKILVTGTGRLSLPLPLPLCVCDSLNSAVLGCS